jgi:hypothetical protein
VACRRRRAFPGPCSTDSHGSPRRGGSPLRYFRGPETTGPFVFGPETTGPFAIAVPVTARTARSTAPTITFCMDITPRLGCGIPRNQAVDLRPTAGALPIH